MRTDRTSSVTIPEPAIEGAAVRDSWGERGARLSGRERLGIFGGTFDPIHFGHLIIAEELKFRLELSRVLFLPSNQPPHKTNQLVSPNVDRMAMLEAALAGNPHFTISTVDIDRPGLSY